MSRARLPASASTQFLAEFFEKFTRVHSLKNRLICGDEKILGSKNKVHRLGVFLSKRVAHFSKKFGVGGVVERVNFVSPLATLVLEHI